MLAQRLGLRHQHLCILLGCRISNHRSEARARWGQAKGADDGFHVLARLGERATLLRCNAYRDAVALTILEGVVISRRVSRGAREVRTSTFPRSSALHLLTCGTARNANDVDHACLACVSIGDCRRMRLRHLHLVTPRSFGVELRKLFFDAHARSCTRWATCAYSSRVLTCARNKARVEIEVARCFRSHVQQALLRR